MSRLSQNKKIAISALAVFIVSFATLLFFFGDSDFGHTNILGGDQGSEDTVDLEAEYREILGAPDEVPIFVTDAEGKFSYASEGFCKLVKVACKDLVDEGHTFLDYVNSKDHSAFVSIYVKLIQDGEKVEAAGPFRISDGKSEKLVLFSARAVFKNKLLSKIIFSIKDLTEKVEELKGDNKDHSDENSDDDDDDTWIDHLYPKIQDMQNGDTRLMVDKVTYVED